MYCSSFPNESSVLCVEGWENPSYVVVAEFWQNIQRNKIAFLVKCIILFDIIYIVIIILKIIIRNAKS